MRDRWVLYGFGLGLASRLRRPEDVWLTKWASALSTTSISDQAQVQGLLSVLSKTANPFVASVGRNTFREAIEQGVERASQRVVGEAASNASRLALPATYTAPNFGVIDSVLPSRAAGAGGNLIPRSAALPASAVGAAGAAGAAGSTAGSGFLNKLLDYYKAQPWWGKAMTIGFPAYSVYNYAQGNQGPLETLADVGVGALTLPMKGFLKPTALHVGAALGGGVLDSRVLGWMPREQQMQMAQMQGYQEAMQGQGAPPVVAGAPQMPAVIPASSGTGWYDTQGNFTLDPRMTMAGVTAQQQAFKGIQG